MKFSQDRFTILFFNQTNTQHKKRMEAVEIKLFSPELNDQVNHKDVRIL
jgi:hypothetical protein